MTLDITLTVTDGPKILTATTDTRTRRSSTLSLDPDYLTATFIALNAVLGEIEAHLSLGTIATPIIDPTA